MWPLYALVIWMAGLLLVDLCFDCTGDRSAMIYLWPLWLPFWLLVMLFIGVRRALTNEPKPGETTHAD